MNAVGLYDLNRNIRAVGAAYKKLIEDWQDLLPAQSVCLTVPIVPPSHAGRIDAREQEGRASAALRRSPVERMPETERR